MGARTELFARRQRGGGLVVADESRTTGEIFFVSSGAGTDGASLSKTPDAPLATIDYAIGLCTAGRGDRIYVMPGHVETVTGAAGVALDVAGVAVIGIGEGHNRPKIHFTTAAAASFDVSAANCRIENLWFNSAIDDQTALLNVTAADVTVRRCEFMLGDGSVDAECGILASAAADRLLVENCRLNSTSSTAITNGAISCGATDDTTIRNCEISGYFGTAGNVVNTAAAANFNVLGCVLVNRSADGNNKNVVLHASTVGMIAGNSLAIIDSTGPAPLTAAAAFVAGNYSVGAVGVAASTLI